MAPQFAQILAGRFAQGQELMNSHHRIEGEEIDVADSWSASVTEGLERSRRTAWIIAGVASAVALLAMIALVILLPLKTVEPYTLLVDRHTGHVEALAPLDEDMVAPTTALTRSLLAQYVIARESFERTSLQRDYRKTMLWSAGDERRRYGAMINSSDAGNPLGQLPPGASIRTEIASVSPLSDGSSLVRYFTILTDRSGREAEPEHWAAVINYTFSDARMSEDDRLLNPLGFQVTYYRRDRETLAANAERQLPADDLEDGA